MNVTNDRDRRRIVFWFVFGPMVVLILAGLLIPGQFDALLFALFPSTTAILCARQGLPWCFGGAIGKAVFYFWVAITSLQWLGYGVAFVSAARRGRTWKVIALLVLVHATLLCVATLAVAAWYQA